VIIIDEIGRELEAVAARTIAERGVQLIGTAHGNSLENLLMNPTLSDLVGGIDSVTLSDEEARRRGTQKSVLERKAPPTFDVLIEIQDRHRMAIHLNVAASVDALLRGRMIPPEVRHQDEKGVVHVERAPEPQWDRGGSNVREGRSGRGRREDGYGSNGPGTSHAQGNFGQGGFGQGGFGSSGYGQGSFAPNPVEARAQERARQITQTGGGRYGEAALFAPRETNGGETLVDEGSVWLDASNPDSDGSPAVPAALPAVETGEGKKRTMRIFPYGIGQNRLRAAAATLNVPVQLVENLNQADAVVTLKNYYRQQPQPLMDAERKGVPVYILRSNTVTQMEQCLVDMFGLSHESNDGFEIAMREAQLGIQRVLNGTGDVELSPQGAGIRSQQHQLVRAANLISHSYGREPYRRVRIFRR
jgi:hypothetical protein